MNRKKIKTFESFINEGVDASTEFATGAYVAYNDGNKEYTGEVVMNPKNQRLNVGGVWKMYGKGAIKVIATSDDTYIVPDDWSDVKKA